MKCPQCDGAGVRVGSLELFQCAACRHRWRPAAAAVAPARGVCRCGQAMRKGKVKDVTKKNYGRSYLACPRPKAESCNAFEFLDEVRAAVVEPQTILCHCGLPALASVNKHGDYAFECGSSSHIRCAFEAVCARGQGEAGALRSLPYLPADSELAWTVYANRLPTTLLGADAASMMAAAFAPLSCAPPDLLLRLVRHALEMQVWARASAVDVGLVCDAFWVDVELEPRTWTRARAVPAPGVAEMAAHAFCEVRVAALGAHVDSDAAHLVCAPRHVALVSQVTTRAELLVALEHGGGVSALELRRTAVELLLRRMTTAHLFGWQDGLVIAQMTMTPAVSRAAAEAVLELRGVYEREYLPILEQGRAR